MGAPLYTYMWTRSTSRLTHVESAFGSGSIRVLNNTALHTTKTSCTRSPCRVCAYVHEQSHKYRDSLLAHSRCFIVPAIHGNINLYEISCTKSVMSLFSFYVPAVTNSDSSLIYISLLVFSTLYTRFFSFNASWYRQICWSTLQQQERSKDLRGVGKIPKKSRDWSCPS
jgi:hypothetical protein